VRLPRELVPWLTFRFRRAGPDAKPTFFFHIPKCAGTSIWASIYDIYGTRHVYLVNSQRRRKKLAAAPDAARAYSAVGGHARLGFFREHLGTMARYHKIVTLRDPIDRAISEYNFIRAQSTHPRNAQVAALSLETFARERLSWNPQVRLLTGRGDDVEGAIDIVTRFFDDWSFSDDVGALVERLYVVTGVEPRDAVHKNKGLSGPHREDLDRRTLRRLEARNRHDLALIEALRRRLTQ